MPGAKPYSLAETMRHPLARMLPLRRYQFQSYRLGEKIPPSGDLRGHGPMWEAVTFVLAARGTDQARVNLQRDFTLIGIATSATVMDHGGFRAQFYDTKKKLRLADRGVMQVNIGGSMAGSPLGGGPSGPFYLREPYCFDQPDSQMLVIVQNMEPFANTIQIAFYGQVLRFNEDAGKSYAEFPGGPVSSWDGGGQ